MTRRGSSPDIQQTSEHGQDPRQSTSDPFRTWPVFQMPGQFGRDRVQNVGPIGPVVKCDGRRNNFKGA